MLRLLALALLALAGKKNSSRLKKTAEQQTTLPRSYY
jgi:hypothetical protein